MLILQTFGPAFGEPDASPFCLKAICLLGMAGVPWKNTPIADPRKAPYKKLPVLIDGDRVIPDSDNIRFHLETRYGHDFDTGLSSLQRAQSRAWIRLVEEHLYFCGMYDRWVDDQSFQYVRQAFFSDGPPVLRQLIAWVVRRSMLRALHGQGIGRLDYAGMLGRAERDLDAIEQAVTSTRFLLSDSPTAVDASVGAFLATAQAHPDPTGLREAIRNRPNCSRYLAEVKKSFYPDH